MKSWWVDCLFDESNHTQHTVDVGVSSMERVYRADEADAEIARLRKAICEWDAYLTEFIGCDPLNPAVKLPPCEVALVKIAREG